MEWVFIILMTSRGSVVLPDKYPAAQCQQIQNSYTLGEVRCFVAPNPNMLKDGCIVGNNIITCPANKKEQ